MLVGIKDTNDQLVAATLRSLADLVPILGSSTVIGGKRAKLFNDGRPMDHPIRNNKRIYRRNSRQDASAPAACPMADIALNEPLNLPERPQPDGEEVDTSTEVEQSAEEDLDNWEDWDANENNQISQSVSTNSSSENSVVHSETVTTSSEFSQQNSSSQTTEYSENASITGINSIGHKKKSLPDIEELDIKSQRNGSQNGTDEFNFFQDMEPVIESSTKYLVTENSDEENVHSKLNNLAVIDSDNREEGWGEEEWD